MEPIISANAVDCKYFILQYYYTLVSHIQDGNLLFQIDPFRKNFLYDDVLLESKITLFFIHNGTCYVEKNSIQDHFNLS